ncbi:MAG: ribose-phosphate diphosphokinase [archaeon]|nr:ribose-phosphate diphosphokinase [archaeon]
MIVVGGSSSKTLATEISSLLKCDYVNAINQNFPDGECYVRIDAESMDDDVVIIQNTYPNNNLIEMLLLEDAVMSLGARTITLVIPYFGYARQDKVFKLGEPESAKVISQCLAARCNRVITVDIHKESTLKYFGCPYKDVKAADAIADYLKNRGIDVVISPDIGAVDRAKRVAERINASYDYIEKVRLSGTEVIMKPSKSNYRGKNILIVDDMITTGGTIITAAKQLRDSGAKSITVACTHGLFINDALNRLKSNNLHEIFASNTLTTSVSKISVASSIAIALKEW